MTIAASRLSRLTVTALTVVSVANGTYAAVFGAPAGALVTLRATADDAADGTITQTISDAYRTAAVSRR